jgi:O-antigen/teichoic acid export membrane protein
MDDLMRDADRVASSPDGERADLAAFAEQDHRGLGRRVRLGLAAQFLSLSSKIAAQLVAVPFFLMAWGGALFGEWMILQALAGLLQLAACGQQIFFGNRIRSAWSVRDYETVRTYFRQGWTFFAALHAVTLLAFAVVAVGVDLTAVFNLQHFTASQALVVLVLLTVQIYSQPLREIVVSVHLAKGELYIAEIIQASALILRTLVLVVLLLAAASPLEVAMFLATFAVTVNLAIIGVDYRRRFRWLLGGPDFRFRAHLRPRHLWTYAIPHAATHVATFLPAVLLGTFSFSGREVVQFNLVRTFTGLLTLWSQQLAKVSGLEISRQRFQADGARRARFAVRAALTFAVAIGFLGGVMFGLVEPVFRIWTAGEVNPMLALVAVLMARTIANALGQYWLAALRLSDHMRDAARTGVGFITCSVLGAIVGVQLGGVVGLAIGLLLADAVFSLAWPALLFARRVWDGRIAPLFAVTAMTVVGFGAGWGFAIAATPFAEAMVHAVGV